MAATTMETNMNSLNNIVFEDNFRKCSTKKCKNDSLIEKETCEICTENIALKTELKRIHTINEEMEEHIVNLETNQINCTKKRRIIKDTDLQQEKLELQNKDINSVVKEVQNLIEERLTTFEESIKDMMVEQVKNNSNPAPPSVTYASAVSTNVTSDKSSISMMHQNQTQKQACDELNRRKRNVIVYGFEENEDKIKDHASIRKFVQEIDPRHDPVIVYRLGAAMATKKQDRPIKLIFKTEKEKENILVKYKDAAHKYDRVYIRNDYSTDERCKIKSFVEEAKRKNLETGKTMKSSGK